MEKIITFDTNIIIDLEKASSKSTKEINGLVKSFPLNKYIWAISETVLYELLEFKNFIIPMTDEYVLEIINKKITELFPLFETYKFYLLRNLHEQFYIELNPTKKSSNIKDLITRRYLTSLVNSPEILNIVNCFALNRGIYKGTQKRLDDNQTNKLKEELPKLDKNIKEIICSKNATLNFLVPKQNKKIKEEKDELFENKLNKEEAIDLTKNSNNKFDIIVLYKHTVYLINDGKIKLEKRFKNFANEFPILFSLVVWNSLLKDCKLKYNCELKTLAETLEPNTINDVQILLESIHSSDKFITKDKGICSYVSIVLSEEFFPQYKDRLYKFN